MAKVKLRNVTKIFGKVVAVNNISLDIEDGEFIVLVGPSGCGKSTVLRMIAGLEDVTSGEIYIDDRLVNDVPPRDRDVAMVFQNYALYPHMNVYRNIAFCLEQRKVPKSEIEHIVKQAAELLRIQELLERRPRELSGGQRQRVALGRAIVRNPKVFLFDEPLSNLDAKLRITMRTELLDLHQRIKTTTIYVTHDQLEAMTMGNRIVVINNGIIQQIDTPQNVYDHPINLFVAGFIGSPPMNFIDCIIEKREGFLWATNKGLSLRVPESKVKLVEKYINKNVILGIRPEHINHTISVTERKLGTTFRASVWVVEPLGAEKLVYLKNENNTILTRLSPNTTLQAGDIGEFIVMMEFAHLFDKETEQTIF